MFERFTDRARRAVVLSQEVAKELDHDYIGTEHLLLGFIRDENNVAAKSLEHFGVTYDAVVAVVGKGDQRSTGHIPFSIRAKLALELALRQALHIGHHYIAPEHILLALIQQGEGVALLTLKQLGVDPEQLRRHVLESLGIDPDTGKPKATADPAESVDSPDSED